MCLLTWRDSWWSYSWTSSRHQRILETVEPRVFRTYFKREKNGNQILLTVAVVMLTLKTEPCYDCNEWRSAVKINKWKHIPNLLMVRTHTSICYLWSKILLSKRTKHAAIKINIFVKHMGFLCDQLTPLNNF